MGNKKTPLLQSLRSIGGTMYVFPSAAEDIGLNLLSTTTGVAMSHFALLNIPAIDVSSCIAETEYIIEPTSNNEALAMSLLNYAMNFETHLINEENYNYLKLETVSERVFWKWARHIGIINTENLSNSSTGNDNVYIENTYDTSSGKQNDTVIKCFGSIDAGNSLSTEFGMFNETYINIPTSWGSGPVFLKRVNDENFPLGHVYDINDPTHLEGREDKNSYYSYTKGKDYPFFDDKNGAKYIIDSSNDGFEILKDINQIQAVIRKQFDNDAIILDSYDDINIDVLDNLNVDLEFDFNAILLYYSVYDLDDLVKTPYATNLFGVIFLDGTIPYTEGNSENKFTIPTIKKRKSTTTQFGNSYSFRVNLKTMSVYDNTDAIIQDNTTMSAIDAVEFSDAISNMNRAIDIMNSNLQTTTAIQDQYAAILNYYDNFENDLHDISTCLNAYLKGARSSFIDTSILYANEIRTSETENSFDLNKLVIKTHKTNSNSINTEYNEPVVTILNNYVLIPKLYNNNLYTEKGYVITELNADDVNVLIDSSSPEVAYCYDAIDKAFSDNGFIVKMKVKKGNGLDNMYHNEIYIDPASTIFNSTNITNLRCLVDASNNINYIGIIPYLVAEIKIIKKLLQSNGISLELDDLDTEDFFGGISGPGIFTLTDNSNLLLQNTVLNNSNE